MMMFKTSLRLLLLLAFAVVDPTIAADADGGQSLRVRVASSTNSSSAAASTPGAATSRNLLEPVLVESTGDGGNDGSTEVAQQQQQQGKERSMGVAVTAPDDSNGKWGPLFDMTLISIHSMILPDNKLLVYGANDQAVQGGMVYEVWDVSNGEHELPEKHILKTYTEPSTNIFCTTDNIDVSTGNVMLIGGDDNQNNGIVDVLEFNVLTHEVQYHPKGNMIYPRWYGTSVMLPDGQIFVVGGRGVNTETFSYIPEIFHPSTGWRELSRARIPSITSIWGLSSNSWWYPHTFVNSHGSIIVFSHGLISQALVEFKDLPISWFTSSIQRNAPIYKITNYMEEGQNGSRQTIGYKPFDSHYLGPSIMYRQDHILFLDNDGYLWDCDIGVEPIQFEKLLNTGYIRTDGSMVILPDGRIFIAGGSEDIREGNVLEQAIYNMQIYDPVSNTIFTGPNQDLARLYHSSSIILPDGAVTSSGGGAPGPLLNANGQVYYPGYLFDSESPEERAQRPIIECFPRDVTSGTVITIQVDDDDSIERVTTTKPGSLTHARNSEARWFDLNYSVVGTNTNRLEVQLPQGNVMLPGLWNLNVINKQGVPSVARMMGVNMASIPESGIPSCPPL